MEYICSITHEIIRDPVTLMDKEEKCFNFEKLAIIEWLKTSKLNPCTNLPFSDYEIEHISTNINLLREIHKKYPLIENSYIVNNYINGGATYFTEKMIKLFMTLPSEEKETILYEHPKFASDLPFVPENVQEKLIKLDSQNFRFINNPTEKVILMTIEKNPWVLFSIKNPSDEAKITAIKSHSLIIRDIENPTQEMILEAMVRGKVHVKGASIDTLRKAVDRLPDIIKYIDKKYQLMFIKENPHLIKHILSPSLEFLETAISIDKTVINDIDELSMGIMEKIVQIDPFLIKFLDRGFPLDVPFEIQKLAVELDPYAIQFIDDAYEEIWEIAIEKEWKILKYCSCRYENVRLKAILINTNSIKYMEIQSEVAQVFAVSLDCWSIRHIRNQCEKAQIIAIKKNIECKKFIKNPCEKAKKIIAKYKKEF
jgi:hypothetical protein